MVIVWAGHFENEMALEFLSASLESNVDWIADAEW